MKKQQLDDKAALTDKGTAEDEANILDSQALADELENAESVKFPVKPEPKKGDDAQAAIAAERGRISAINALALKHNIDDIERNRLIDDGSTIDQARAAALDYLSTQDSQRQPSAGLRVIHTDGEAFKESMANAMLNRINPGQFKLEDSGREFRGQSLLNLAAACLERVGKNTRGMSGNELAAMALNTTSDFPLIVADVANKVLIQSFNAQPRTFMDFCRQTNISDFKLRHAIEIGGGSSLEQVNEAGEFKTGALTEGEKTYKLETYGRIFSFSRQLLINDDLGALDTFMANVGAQAARKETNVVYDVLKNTSGIYTAGNKNVGTGAAVTETSLSEARKLLRQMTDSDNNRINVVGRYLVVNSERETEAQKLLAAVLSTQTSEVNAFANSLMLIVEPELDGVTNDPWYIFADPSVVPCVEYAYLSGEQAPYLETKQGFEVDGIQMKVRHDFGAGFVSHRGTIRNPGV